MMKFALVAAAVIAVAAYGVSAGSYGRNGYERMNQNVTEMISQYGYMVQNFTVTTTDGYILDVIRVPGCQRSQCQRMQQEQGRRLFKTNRTPVILSHAMLSSSEDFVVGGQEQGLVFTLVDAEYDVFLFNARGSRYGRKHTTLNPERDSAFWRFCFEDIARKDLPAVMDRVIEITGKSKVMLMGHMEGTTPMFVMSSMMPEYNEKIDMIIALGPMAFMKDATNIAMRRIAEKYESKTWVAKNLGISEFHPSTTFIDEVSTDCISLGVNERVCQNPFFLINGYESKTVNTTTVNRYVHNLPAGTSTKNVLHYAHLISTGRFERYCEDKSKCSGGDNMEYDLSKVSARVALYFATEDKLVAQSDIERLAKKLPNCVQKFRCSQCQNNLDMVFGKEIRGFYGELVRNMRQHSSSKFFDNENNQNNKYEY